jgi:hypothetical protein
MWQYTPVCAYVNILFGHGFLYRICCFGAAADHMKKRLTVSLLFINIMQLLPFATRYMDADQYNDKISVLVMRLWCKCI